jgi:hypothetical protein
MATNLAQQSGFMAPNRDLHTPAPELPVTFAPESAASQCGNAATDSHLSQRGGIADDTQSSHGIQEAPGPGSTSSPHPVPLADTQDTSNITQQNEVFSPPADFEHSTPPTQEAPEDRFSQMNTSNFNDGVGSRDEEMADVSQDPLGSTVPTPARGKRRRNVRDTSGDTPGAKRSKRKR